MPEARAGKITEQFFSRNFHCSFNTQEQKIQLASNCETYECLREENKSSATEIHSLKSVTITNMIALSTTNVN